MRTRSIVLAVICLCAIAHAQTNFAERVVEHRLSNGLRVLILPRRQSPTVAFYILHRVGGVDEESGRTGVTHMLEHMLFKGTTTIGTRDYEREKPIWDEIERLRDQLEAERARGDAADRERIAQLQQREQELLQQVSQWLIPQEYDRIFERAGSPGTNAWTSNDVTVYTVSIPANRLELAAWMQADQRSHPVWRQFYQERDVVLEERRQSVNDSPEGALWEAFMATAFLVHPYRNPVIGWQDDVARLRTADIDRFFRTYYAPNNTWLAVVGDVDPQQTIALVEKYFGSIPAQPLPQARIPAEPPQRGIRRVVVKMPANPQMLMGFHKPNAPHEDDVVFSVIQGILTRGRTSRLYRELVEKRKIALSVSAYSVPGDRYPNLFVIDAVPRYPHTPQELEQAIWHELNRLRTQSVTEAELKRMRTWAEADILRALRSNEGMAEQLLWADAVLGDWRELFRSVERVRRVTAQDILRVAKKYLHKDNCTVAVLEPAPEAK
ncbi:MAG: insulinase family protein [Chthonomonadetes bacterium]|nr:insulinase family protein [Chthonomonadetes bacterium]